MNLPGFSIYYNLIINLKNIPGWRTSRKIVVIECDDWGGIRIPSKEIYEKLIKGGLAMDKGRFRYDTLETIEDLDKLFTILDSVKDKNGHSAVMSPITNTANPDFEKIKQSDFKEYHYEKFTETLIRYGRGTGVFKLWKQGIQAGVFVPELHGREHITVQIWLQKLREGNKDLLLAFDNGLAAVEVPGVHPAAGEFRPEFYFDSESQKPFLKRSIIEGVNLFKEIFGYTPRVFVPSNGIFHPDFEETVTETGVKFLYVSHSMPYPVNGGELKYRRFITGQRGPGDLTYYTRNCAFEPTSAIYKGIDPTLKQIAAAFRWHKPANISTHRVNFAGGIEPASRERGLSELSKLLQAIVKRWPDVEFMSSGDALEFMRNSN
jgi:hypothetical protein